MFLSSSGPLMTSGELQTGIHRSSGLLWFSGDSPEAPLWNVTLCLIQKLIKGKLVVSVSDGSGWSEGGLGGLHLLIYEV